MVVDQMRIKGGTAKGSGVGRTGVCSWSVVGWGVMHSWLEKTGRRGLQVFGEKGREQFA